jgi:hypothetical protein
MKENKVLDGIFKKILRFASQIIWTIYNLLDTMI